MKVFMKLVAMGKFGLLLDKYLMADTDVRFIKVDL